MPHRFLNIRPLRAALLIAALCLPAAAGAMQPDLSSLSSVPLHTASPAVVSKALEQVDSKSRPLKFAVLADLPLTMAQGLWDTPETGIARWRTRVASPGALGLSLNFSRFHLPAGAELWLYDDAGRLVQGPYTHADENKIGQLWTALVPGASAVVELRVPEAARGEVQLAVGKLSHAFIDLSKAQATLMAKSGSCNVDVACSDGNNWRDQIRSVALVSVGETGVLCSGELVNNQRGNLDPLFLTANHCLINTQSRAASVVLYWNYQTRSCGGTPLTANQLTQNQSGASLLANDTRSDFTLLRLANQPNPSFEVFYSGWDVNGAVPQSGVAIHHPNGDDKRISTYDSPASAQSLSLPDVGTVDAWEIFWAKGTTETGSSGGGLWNQNGRLVGVLSGGAASCENPGQPDYFARLAGAYTASPQLKAALDPDNTGTKSMDGLDTRTDGGGGGGAMSIWMLVIFSLGVLMNLRVASRRSV